MELKEVESPEAYKIAINLFRAYASELNIDLGFQDFENEIETIEKHYARPEGAIFIAYNKDEIAIGCIAIRKLEDSICELKRMYIKHNARGKGLGRKLLEQAIKVAIDMGYDTMRLDTLSSMTAAIKLYEGIGFYEIDAYRFNPTQGAKYYELNLQNIK